MQRADRIGWIEWARVLGAVGVVVLHVLTSSFAKVPEDISDARLAGYIVASVMLGRWAVPGFFMITGYLLIDPAREITWTRAWHYAKRMILVLLTFGFAFSLLEEVALSLSAGESLSIEIVVFAARDVLTASSWDHLWYVYALVGVYLLVPVARKVHGKLGEHGFALLTLWLFALVLVVPTGIRLWQGFFGSGVEAPKTGLLALVTNVPIGITCFCIGGCMRNWQPRRLLPIVLAGIISVGIMIAVGLTGLFVDGYGDMGFVFLQGSCFACVYAVCVLMVLRRRMGGRPIQQSTLLSRLAEDSFGIYVIHPLFVHLVLLKANPLAFPPILFEAAFVFVVLVVSDASTRALRHVPFIGSLL